jgi:hypothetical protein
VAFLLPFQRATETRKADAQDTCRLFALELGLSASQAALESVARRGAPRSRAILSFYAAMATVLFLFVLLGFSRTLYMRSFFDVRPIGFWVWVHGITLTAWFVGLMLQTALVNMRRIDVHRVAGWALATLAVFVAISSIWLSTGVVPTLLAAGLDANVVTVLGPRVAWGNYVGAATFAVLVGVAIALRRNSQAHKRLMLLASIAIISPALARIFQWPVFGAEINARFFVLAFLSSFVLAGVVAAYDLVTRKRLHPATLVGALVLIGAKIVGVLVISQTELGRALVPGLS